MTVEDTTGAMLPPPPGSPVAAVAPRAWYRDRFSVVVLVLVSVLLAGVASFYTVPAQWVGRILPGNSVVDDGAVALKPGSARPTDDRVQASDIQIFEPEGEILFTTVAVDDQVTIADWVRANSDDAVELRTREQVFGARTTAEQRERNLELMAVSKESAVVAALEYLGVEAVVEALAVDEASVEEEVVAHRGERRGVRLERGAVVGRVERAEVERRVDAEALSAHGDDGFNVPAQHQGAQACG